MASNDSPVMEPPAGSQSDVETGDGADARPKLVQSTEITSSGPCRKHVTVTISREEVNRAYEQTVGQYGKDLTVPGFRPGKVPRALVEKRFRKELLDQVKKDILLASLEQLTSEKSIDPISEPDLDFEAIQLPEEGDFVYSFDVEVRPEFELPDFTAIEIERPVAVIDDAEIERQRKAFLKRVMNAEPSLEPAAPGDLVTVKITSRFNGRELMGETAMVRLLPTLTFRDALIEQFDALMTGVVAGDVRTTTATISIESPNVDLRSETVEVEFEVLEVLRDSHLEPTPELLSRYGVATIEELNERLRDRLQRQIEYMQRQRTRSQVLEKIAESSTWELPEDLVKRQVENALRREILEMMQAGFTEAEIRARENELLQNARAETTAALKQHFILDRIARKAQLAVTPDDIEQELQIMADERGESPRKVRARLEKQDMLENLHAQVLERKAVDVILSQVKMRDVPLELSREPTSYPLSFPLAGEPSPATVAARRE